MSRAPAWLPLLVVAVAWLAQGGALGADWVLDDAAIVRDNPYLEGTVSDVGRVFQPGAWHAESEPGAWRPLALLTLALEAPLWRSDVGGLSPFGFHLTNLILHGVAALLLLLLAQRVLEGRWPLAAAAALLFAVHPVHAPTLARVAGRADVLALVLLLGTALLWRTAMRRGSAWIPLVALGYLLALLAKETVIGLPFALLAVDFALGVRTGGTRRRWAAFGALSGVAAVYLALSPSVLGPALVASAAPALEGLSRAAVSILLPVGLVRDALEVPGETSRLWVGGGALLVGAAGTLLLARRGGAAAGGLAAFVILGFLGAIVAPEGAPLEARFAYVIGPGAFVILGILLLAVAIPEAKGARRAAGLAAGVVALFALGFLAWEESAAWQDEAGWHDALIRRHPDSGALILRRVRRLRTEAEGAQALTIGMPVDSAEHKAGIRRFRRLLGEAYRGAVALRDRDPAAAVGWAETGFVQLLGGLTPEAGRSLARALEIDEAQPEAHRARANGLLVQGQNEAASRHATRALELAPDDLDTLQDAGLLLTRTGHHYRGLGALRRAVDLARSPSEAMNLDRLFQQARRGARDLADVAMREAASEEEQRRYHPAVSAYERVLRADPSRLAAYLRLAWIRGEYFGDYRSAHGILDRAERILKETGGADAKAMGRIDKQRQALFDQQRRDEEEEGED